MLGSGREFEVFKRMDRVVADLFCWAVVVDPRPRVAVDVPLPASVGGSRDNPVGIPSRIESSIDFENWEAVEAGIAGTGERGLRREKRGGGDAPSH